MTIKKILIIFLFSTANLIFSQAETTNLNIDCTSKIIVPLRTFTEIPENQCYYRKDTNNELQDYVGTWVATWNNKKIFITFYKITMTYSWSGKYYKDYLIAKYKVINTTNNSILFDNTNLPNDQAKITGTTFRKKDDKYSLIYIDNELCYRTGDIRINFTDSSKTKLLWWYGQDTHWIGSDCFYYGLPNDQKPEPLPKNIILSKL